MSSGEDERNSSCLKIKHRQDEFHDVYQAYGEVSTIICCRRIAVLSPSV
jgi:hypothetical protein